MNNAIRTTFVEAGARAGGSSLLMRLAWIFSFSGQPRPTAPVPFALTWTEGSVPAAGLRGPRQLQFTSRQDAWAIGRPGPRLGQVLASE